MTKIKKWNVTRYLFIGASMIDNSFHPANFSTDQVLSGIGFFYQTDILIDTLKKNNRMYSHRGVQ